MTCGANGGTERTGSGRKPGNGKTSSETIRNGVSLIRNFVRFADLMFLGRGQRTVGGLAGPDPLRRLPGECQRRAAYGPSRGLGSRGPARLRRPQPAAGVRHLDGVPEVRRAGARVSRDSGAASKQPVSQSAEYERTEPQPALSMRQWKEIQKVLRRRYRGVVADKGNERMSGVCPAAFFLRALPGVSVTPTLLEQRPGYLRRVGMVVVDVDVAVHQDVFDRVAEFLQRHLS